MNKIHHSFIAKNAEAICRARFNPLINSEISIPKLLLVTRILVNVYTGLWWKKGRELTAELHEFFGVKSKMKKWKISTTSRFLDKFNFI